MVWAPFSAVITLAAFRYFDRAELPRWRCGFDFGPHFGAAVIAGFIVDFVYRYSGLLQSEIGLILAQRQLQSPWVTPIADDYQTLALMNYLVLLGVFAVNAAVSIASTGVLWMIATKRRIDLARLRQIWTLFPLSLFSFFFLLEIVYHQLFTLYYQALYWIDVPLPAGSDSLSWRERILPEAATFLPDIPIICLANLVWLSAAAVAYRRLEAQDA